MTNAEIVCDVRSLVESIGADDHGFWDVVRSDEPESDYILISYWDKTLGGRLVCVEGSLLFEDIQKLKPHQALEEFLRTWMSNIRESAMPLQEIMTIKYG